MEIINLIKQEGREIDKIFFVGGHGVQANKNEKIALHNEFHGEYDLNWAVVFVNGKEHQRFNLKLCEGFEWKGE